MPSDVDELSDSYFAVAWRVSKLRLRKIPIAIVIAILILLLGSNDANLWCCWMEERRVASTSVKWNEKNYRWHSVCIHKLARYSGVPYREQSINLRTPQSEILCTNLKASRTWRENEISVELGKGARRQLCGPNWWCRCRCWVRNVNSQFESVRRNVYIYTYVYCVKKRKLDSFRNVSTKSFDCVPYHDLLETMHRVQPERKITIWKVGTVGRQGFFERNK